MAHNITDLPDLPGVSPFKLEFGRDPVLPEEAGLQGHPLIPLSKEDYGKGMVQRIQAGQKDWADINREQREKQKARHDEEVAPYRLKVGDYCLMRRPPNKGSKL